MANQTEKAPGNLAEAGALNTSVQANDTTACPHCGHSLTVDYWTIDCNGCGWGTDAASPNEGLSDRSLRGGI